MHAFCRKAALSRSARRGLSRNSSADIKSRYDAVIVGAGHNGLIAATYLQRAGKSVCVLERRHIVGGAACTEEIIPGFKFSRASYLLSLLRPDIWRDLELKKRGVKIHFRDPNSYTPMLDRDENEQLKSLLLGRNAELNAKEIAKFSANDAKAYQPYEEYLAEVVDAISPLMDSHPPDFRRMSLSSWGALSETWAALKPLLRATRKLGAKLPHFYDLIMSPASKTLKRWFESEPLMATLATDSIIGAMISPHEAQSGYVLLHHVMGELDGVKGAWGYVEGGMGALSSAIADAAKSYGAHIFTDKPVSRIVTRNGKATGVVLSDGQEISAGVVLSNATAKVTYTDLMDTAELPETFMREVNSIEYKSSVTKINVAVNKLPNFLANPNTPDNKPLPHHQCTIHLNCENMDLLHSAFLAAREGAWSERPVIEMTIPSSKDPTLAPAGCHVVLLFTMYTPFTLAGGRQWDEETKSAYADTVFNSIERYAPGFKESVIGKDILTPPDLENVFGLTGGNIFHGAMSLDQLYMTRPTLSHSGARTPISGLYICGSSSHPGGGVMGAPGKLAAEAALKDGVL